MSTPGTLLPSISPALEDLRFLAAACRACSAKGYVDSVLRRRGTKDVDLRTRGVTIRFKFEPHVVEPAECLGGEKEDPVTRDRSTPADSQSRDLLLSIGCCIYQKGKYLLGHVEGGQPAAPRRLRTPSPFPPPPQHSEGEVGKVVADLPSPGVHASSVENLPLSIRKSAPLEPPEVPPLFTDTTTNRDGGVPPRTFASKAHDAQEEEPAHWGGGPGPRPCKEALAIVQSLRVPLSDPHYFRICTMSLFLKETYGTGGVMRQTQVLGGGDNPGDGWAGEFLVTRCAVAGNPRQPRTRADFMLSRIRVEASCVLLLHGN